MVIDYSKQTWVDGDTSKPLDAARLGHIESGVKAAADGVDVIVGELDGRLSEEELNAMFVAVRTSDGKALPPGTIVVITLDKTLAQVTANPVADIADITFTTGA